MFVDGSGRNELTLQRIFHRCFLPSISSFGWGLSEEKIKMWKVNGRRTTDAKWWQKLTLPLARWSKNHITGHMRVTLFLFVLWCLKPLSTIFSYIVVSVLIYWKPEYREKTTDLSQIIDKLYHIMFYTSSWSRFELTTSVVIGIWSRSRVNLFHEHVMI